jgi:1-acyl-sn-glycerol-3-phosphate acyltransferase
MYNSVMIFLRSLWWWTSAVGFWIVFSVPAVLFFCLFTLVGKPGSTGVVIVGRWLCRFLLWANRISTSGPLNLKYQPGTIYLSNHQSIIDILVLTKHLPLPFHFVAKDSLFKIPLFGFIMKAAGFVPINREQPRRALETINDIAERVKKGHCMLLFPEGTRSLDGHIAEFKAGFLKILEKANCPVRMVYIDGTLNLIKKGTLLFTPGPVSIKVSDEIKPDEYQNLSKEEALKFFREKLLKTI